MKIFYSWQSDLDEHTNKRAIRYAITDVNNNINVSSKNLVELDEATRNEAVSPEIPVTILEKIKKCDIFIGDLTIINSTSNCARKMPNSKVLFELGYAVSLIGWERIIMLFNTNFGEISLLPFDLPTRRLTTYKIADKSDSSGKGNLKSTLNSAISTIITKEPPKGF